MTFDAPCSVLRVRRAAGRSRPQWVETGSRLGAVASEFRRRGSEMSAFLAERTWDSAIGRPPLVCTKHADQEEFEPLSCHIGSLTMNPNKALWEKGDFTRLAQSMRKSGESLVKGLGITKGLKVLDLGCGDGTTALPESHARSRRARRRYRQQSG